MLSFFKKNNILLLKSLTLLCLFSYFFFFHPQNEIDEKTWRLFAVFICTIFAVIFEIAESGILGLTAITFLSLFKITTISQALSTYANPIVWLIFTAFFMARAIIKTGLGKRIAYFFLAHFGKGPLGLSYSICLTELFLAPFIPSNTARGAGVVFPIVGSIADNLEENLGAKEGAAFISYLHALSFQVNMITSALFLTAMAGNPLVVAMAGKFGVEITWMGWLKAACVPGLISLILLPHFLRKVLPFHIKKTDLSSKAKTELREMGLFSLDEKKTLFIFFVVIGIWIFGPQYGISATEGPLLGIVLMLFGRVLTWNDILNEKAAFNTFLWFAPLLMMANLLWEQGMMDWFGKICGEQLGDLQWQYLFIAMGLVYFFSHYFFANTTGHISSMYPPFLAILVAKGISPLLAALSLAYFSSLSACLTHYGTGTAPVYFAASKQKLSTWFKTGLAMSLYHLAIFGVIGVYWWKIIGLY